MFNYPKYKIVYLRHYNRYGIYTKDGFFSFWKFEQTEETLEKAKTSIDETYEKLQKGISNYSKEYKPKGSSSLDKVLK